MDLNSTLQPIGEWIEGGGLNRTDCQLVDCRFFRTHSHHPKPNKILFSFIVLSQKEEKKNIPRNGQLNQELSEVILKRLPMGLV